MSDIRSQFRSPLMVGNDADGWLVCEAAFGPLSKPKPDAVISAQSAAAGENEASGFCVSRQVAL